MYRTTITIEAYYETEGDPNEIVNELLDRFGQVNTEDLKLTWDDCEWEHYEVLNDNLLIELDEKE